jgi:integral membrane protein (TIGR00529 family)
MLAVIIVLAVFILIIMLMKLRLELGYALLAGAGVLGLCFQLSPRAIVSAAGQALTSRDTFELAGTVALILVLSHIQEKTGQFERLLHAFRDAIRDVRFLFVALPALIGLLPMPGGAVFSAPMIDTAARDTDLTPAQKSAINLWFRHIWEYTWPLYPGVVLAAKLAEVPLRTMVLFQSVLTIVALGAGLVVLLRQKHPRTLPMNSLPGQGQRMLIDLSPILVIILGILVFKVHILVALVAGIILTLVINRTTPRQTWTLLVYNRKVVNMVVMVAGIMVFKGMLKDAHAVDQITVFLREHHIPLLATVMAVPFVVGLVTGITVAYVGITYPIIIPLVGLNTPLLLPYLMVGFAFGFMGVMLSPVHLCMVMSNQYFKADLAAVYRYLMVLAGVVMAAALVYFMAAVKFIV